MVPCFIESGEIMEFKDKIKKLRTDLGMTMDELARKVGVSTPTIQRYESGEIKNVRRDKIQLLADALETTPSYLMDWGDDSKSNAPEDEMPEEIKILSRAAKNMTPENRQKLLEMAKIMFREDFHD